VEGKAERVARELNRLMNSFSFLVGRRETIRLVLLALISRQHIYMISPPGTGKTMTDAVARAFGLRHVYYLFHYDTKLEDIVYSPIIRREPVNDGERIVVEYELKDPGLGTADVFFADEMFKAPTPVLNALLGAMNERRINLGTTTVKIPLRTLVAASNELPADADALLDRFLFRHFIRYLPKDSWADYLVTYWRIHKEGVPQVKADPKVLDDAHSLMWNVDVFTVMEDYMRILEKLEDKGITVSDRRKGRILQAIAASAVMDGRMTAEPQDLQVLVYTVPANEDEYATVVKEVDDYLGGLLAVREELEKLAGKLKSEAARIPSMNNKELAELVEITIPHIVSKASRVDFPSLTRHVEEIKRVAEDVREKAIDALARKALGVA